MKATERIGQTLAFFTAAAPERGTAEIAGLLGVANSSAHQILNGLAAVGLLRKQAPGRFRLGPMVSALGQVLESTDTVIEAARPILARTAADYGETVHVTELVGDKLTALSCREGHQLVSVSKGLYDGEAPLHAVAPGKLLLAQQSAADRDRSLSTLPRVAFTDRTVVQQAVLGDELREIAAAGYCEAVAEWHPDLATCAASIRSQSGRCVAAFALAVPLTRFQAQPRAYRHIVVEAADAVSARLGWAARAVPAAETPALGGLAA